MRKCQPRKVEHAERMFEAGVFRTWPDPRDEAELLDSFEALKGAGADQRDLWFREEDAIVERVTYGGDDRKSGARYVSPTPFGPRFHQHAPTV
jgi:hypothetical protein